jgi:hypothetical protein
VRLANWCALSAAAFLVVGLTPIAFVQFELAIPRVQLFTGQLDLFNAAIVAHGLILAVCVPLAVAALGFAVAAETRKSRAWTSASVLVLGVSLLAATAVVALSVSGTPVTSSTVDLAAIPSALVLLFSAVVVAATFKGARAVPLFLWLSVPMFAGAALLMTILNNNGIDAGLYDTYYALAPTHALGLAVILLTLAVFTAYVGRNTNRPRSWFGALFGASILSVGGLAVLLTATLGLSGLPRRLFDYPEAFAGRQLELSICSAVLLLLIVAAFGSLALMHRRTRAQDAK